MLPSPPQPSIIYQMILDPECTGVSILTAGLIFVDEIDVQLALLHYQMRNVRISRRRRSLMFCLKVWSPSPYPNENSPSI